MEDRLNPEISSLRHVVAIAEIMKIAHLVTRVGPSQHHLRRAEPIKV